MIEKEGFKEKNCNEGDMKLPHYKMKNMTTNYCATESSQSVGGCVYTWAIWLLAYSYPCSF